MADADGECTFAELHAEAIACAQWLVKQGVSRGDVVALQLPKRRATYTIWLACIRQGFVYVFLDPRNPAARTDAILRRVKPALLVTTSGGGNPFGRALPDTELERVLTSATGDAAVLPAAPLHGLSPAYIMFTSGSTGEPKGAVIPHQGILSLMKWVHDWIDEPQRERFANVNPLHFDNSVFDLYCGLLNGAALVPVETGELPNPLAWVKALRRGRASVVFAVPTLFTTLDRLRLLTRESLPDVRTFLFGGEGFPIDALRRFHGAFAGAARLINVYGPTETSCICSSIEIDDDALLAAGGGFASLGRLHEGFVHRILDDQRRPVGAGQVGELWLGGANVGLGYFDNPEETAQRFHQDPLERRYRSVWYRTGDLVREDDAGLLWFHGRADNQVKIRGHRIELEEIDLALERFPNVVRAVAVAAASADGLEIRAAFCAREPVDPADIQAHCLASLPSYMQPARVVQLDDLPLNANGKVDRRAARQLLERER